MKKKRVMFGPGLILAMVAAVQLLSACAGQRGSRTMAGNHTMFPAPDTGFDITADPLEIHRLTDLLDQLAESERAGLFQPGTGMAESTLRERLGDYSGAVIAVYKEMSWAYGHGLAGKSDIVKGMAGILTLEGMPGRENAVLAAHAINAFEQERWEDAQQQLTGLMDIDDDLDSFINWIMLSCTLEQDPANRRAISEYRVIRARYSQHPGYWHRGARLFPGIVGVEFAENCINLAPSGPYAAECRSILASFSGLKPEDGPAMKTKMEIEYLVAQAVTMGNPRILEPILPLIELPENPFTVFAIDALKSLAAIPAFRDYFTGLAAVSNRRLADRLTYISRG